MGLAITTQGGRINNYVIEGYVDTFGDLDHVQKEYAAGSKIIVIEDGSEWVLNSNKIWKKLHRPGGGGGSSSGGSGGTTTISGIQFVDSIPSPSTAQDGVIYGVKTASSGPDDYEMWGLKDSEMVQLDMTSEGINDQVEDAVNDMDVLIKSDPNNYANDDDLDSMFQ